MYFPIGAFISTDFINYILPFVIVLGTMIFIHELGHFAVAKLFKIKVEVFSLGFGPRLLGYTYGDTDYRVCAIPLGGYVKMKGETLDEDIEGTGDEFLARPKWQRFLVLLAGPAMNIVAAIAIPAAMAMVSYQSPAFLTQPAVVAGIEPESAGASAGFQVGDRIVKFGESVNPNWGQVIDLTVIRPGQATPVVVVRNGQEIALTLTPGKISLRGEAIGTSGLQPDQGAFVRNVIAGAPAAVAGLHPKDSLRTLDGQPILGVEHFKTLIQKSEGRPVTLGIERDGQAVQVTVQPRKEGTDYRVGVELATKTISGRKSLGGALVHAYEENLRVLTLTKEAFAQIFTGHRDVRDALAGPIGIAKASGDTYKSFGIEGLFGLMWILSLNLGVFNLLPIPVLDGGHMFIIVLESLLGLVGLKLSVNIKEKMMQTGFVMLFLLMGFVIFNDVAKMFRTSPETPKTQNAAPAGK